MPADTLIITGGTGYIGARLIERALAQGRAVIMLGRRGGPAGTRHVEWTLGTPIPPSLSVPPNSALIHLAHDWRAGAMGNVDGSETLFASARARGIENRVFISSQSARADALNLYGRMKWAAEQRLAMTSALRVGLVYGGPRRAMYGLLCRLACLPVLPMIEPERPVQPIHLDEVVRGILSAADGRATGVLALAGPEEVAFGDVLRALARAFHGRRLRIVPIPLQAALLACDISARLPVMPTIDKERVLGLAGTEPIDSALDLARLGLAVRPMAEMLPGEPAGRRATLAEGHAFLRYVGIRPAPTLLRRYARAWTEGAIIRPRWGLRCREPLGSASRLARRLRVASRIAEASAPGEAVLARGSRLGRLVHLGLACALEAVLLPVRLIVSSGR